MSKQINNLLLFIIIAASITSCIPQKKLRYIQELEESSIDTADYLNIRNKYKFKVGDLIYLKVYSINEKNASIFNRGENNNRNDMNSPIGLYLNGYTVSDSGFIRLPIVGNVNILGLTEKESCNKVEYIIRKYIKDATVVIKLAGFNITLIGEVKHPGKIAPLVSNLNIFEAIAMAGELTSYGNRKKVLIIREVNGKNIVKSINILDRNIIMSKDYYLQPNDIIYVESMNAKAYGFERVPYSIIFSTLSMTIVLITFFRTF